MNAKKNVPLEKSSPENFKTRLDLYVKDLLQITRSQAVQLIESGSIEVNQAVCTKVAFPIFPDDQVLCKNPLGAQYVSRAALKLKHALETFKFSVQHKKVLDVGAATGGFTQILLEYGAQEIFAIDVGHGQLHPQLHHHPQLQYFEGINARDPLPFQDIFDLIVMDVSFISILKIIPNLLQHLANKGFLIILIKPQFEQTLEQKHLVLSSKQAEQYFHHVKDELKKLHLNCLQETISPLYGKEGNREYLVLCQKIF